MSLDGWDRGSFTAAGITHDTYRKGSGPGVVVVHEIPGITPAVLAFAEEVVAAGLHRGDARPVRHARPRAASGAYVLSSDGARCCISREFTTWAMNRTSPIIGWLRALARNLHLELGGPGVGAVGMCFTGGFALAMMVDDTIVAPVLSQPSLPFAVGKARSANLGLSPDDALVVAERAANGCPVMGLRFTGDRRSAPGSRRCAPCSATRSAVEFPSANKTRPLGAHRAAPGRGRRARVLEFFHERLDGSAGSGVDGVALGPRVVALAVRRAWHLVDEDHPLRRLVAGELLLDAGDDRRLVDRCAGSTDVTALTAWPKRSSSTPTTRQSTTPGTRLTASSTSSGKIFSPPELITLLPRPSRISEPSAATLAMSPGNE